MSAMIAMSLLVVACTDDIDTAIETPKEEVVKGDLIFLSAGTTENSVSTRANTYFMPKDYRFVCKMYFKTDISGERYDLDRSQTAWMKVEADRGNSLYWNKAYTVGPTKNTGGPNNDGFDSYRNDYYASKFYWQNRREHAFLAWTDLNKVKAAIATGSTVVYNGNDLTFDFDSTDDYTYKTGTKADMWVDKNFFMEGDATKYSSLKASINKVIEHYSTVVTEAFTTANNTKLSVFASYKDWESSYYRYDNHDQPAKIYTSVTPEEIDETHRNMWYVLEFFDPGTRTEFQAEDGVTYADEQHYGYQYKVNGDLLVAVLDNADNKYYNCDRHGDYIYNENSPRITVCVKLSQTFEEDVDVVKTVEAKRFDLRGYNEEEGRTSISAQPDVVLAWEPDHIPTSAVMEDNRVNLYFKHQFSQVQVNIKNSADNSVEITGAQIDKVELLGVTDYGYVFPYLEYNEAGVGSVRGSAFKEVVASDYTNEILDDNPYGTYFEMFTRTMTYEDEHINKYIKSYEGITFGRLQAIRITWQEAEANGKVHVATYRVDETNDQGQSLRLLERGKKYIWNMELRRGTLAVIRTEIIPWEVNPTSYVVDGSIVKTTTGQ